MADVNTTIGSTGDYASLALAEADDFGCTTGQTALCTYIEAMTDTTAVTINTTVPSAIEITVGDDYWHKGDITAGAVLAPTTGATSSVIFVNSNTATVTIRRLRIACSVSAYYGIRCYNISINSTISHILVHGCAYGIASQYGSQSVLAYRCAVLCLSTGTPSGFICASDTASLTCYQCSVYSASYAAFRGSNSIACYGCIGFGLYPFYGTFTGDYNADNTSGTTYDAPGSNSKHNLTPANELTDVANGDFSVKSTSTNVKDGGYNYGSPYNVDIAGNTVTGTWDIGAFEYFASGGTTRSLIANLAGASTTGAISAYIVRGLTADIQAASVTGDISAEMSGIRMLLASISGTSTTSSVSATVLRLLSGDIVGASITPDVAGMLARSIVATIPVSSTTPAVAAYLLREMVADILGASTTSEITAEIAGVISLVANIQAVSVTGNIAATTARSVAAAITGASLTGAAVSYLSRSIAANIAAASVTGDATISLSNLISIAASITGASITGNVASTIARGLAADIAADSSTGSVGIAIDRALTAAIAGGSVTPNNVVLILLGLGILLDTELVSLTPVLSMVSLTPRLEILSETATLSISST